tara:strand:- start:117 stop:437 length:321 start_codon:yes stop_codon:yes gene_type:complete
MDPIQGVIAINSKKIPIRILICAAIISVEELIMPKLKIIRGMLRNKTIIPPIEKLFSLRRFIEAEIIEKHVNVGELSKNVIKIKYIFSISIFNIKHAIVIIIIKGS